MINVTSVPPADYSESLFTFQIQQVSSSGCKVYVEGSGSISVGGSSGLTEYNLSNSAETIVCSNGDYRVYITNKYAIKRLTFITELYTKVTLSDSSVRDVKYWTRLEQFAYPLAFTSLSDFKDCANLQILSVRPNKQISGGFSDLPNLIDYLNLDYCTAFVDILSNIAGKTALSTLNLRSTKVTGSIESLASAMVAAGRTSGVLALKCNGYITYNGEAVADNSVRNITFDSSLPGGYSVS